MCGDDHDTVRAAIDEKLKRYKVPLIVALEMVDCIGAFETVEDVLYGRTVMKIPINTATGGPAGPLELGRAKDGIVVRRDHNAERARDRLDAILPFQVHCRDDGFRVAARVLANPFTLERPELLEFRPIPRLVVTESTRGQVVLQMFGDADTPVSRDACDQWSHRPTSLRDRGPRS